MSTESYRPQVWRTTTTPKTKPTTKDVEELVKDTYGSPTEPFFVSGITSSAAGSIYYENGSTKILCSIYGPKSNSKTQYSDTGVLACDFSYAPFALDYRRRQGKYSPEETRISISLKETLSNSIDLSKFPKHEIEIFIVVLECGFDEINAAINAASLALIDSGLDVYGLNVASTSAYIKSKSDKVPTIKMNPTVEDVASKDCLGTVSLAYIPTLQQVSYISQTGVLSIVAVQEMLEKNREACVQLEKFFKTELRKDLEDKLTQNE